MKKAYQIDERRAIETTRGVAEGCPGERRKPALLSKSAGLRFPVVISTSGPSGPYRQSRRCSV